MCGTVSNPEAVLRKLMEFEVAIPSWALGPAERGLGVSRVANPEPGGKDGRYRAAACAEPFQRRGLLTYSLGYSGKSCASQELAAQHGIRFDAMNSNTFQDQPGQAAQLQIWFDAAHRSGRRRQAVEHNIGVIKQGVELGSTSLTVWLADGSCFPGQLNFRKAFQNTLEGLQEIYAALPATGKCLSSIRRMSPIFIRQPWATGDKPIVRKQIGKQSRCAG